MNHDAEAAYSKYFWALAPPILPVQYQDFCVTEISVPSAIRQGDIRRLKYFYSASFFMADLYHF